MSCDELPLDSKGKLFKRKGTTSIISLIPGRRLLHPQVPLGCLRGGLVANHRPRTERGHLPGDGEEGENKGADGLFGKTLEVTSHLRDSVLYLRVPLPDQHYRATDPHEQVLRWRVLDLRLASDEFLGDATGE